MIIFKDKKYYTTDEIWQMNILPYKNKESFYRRIWDGSIPTLKVGNRHLVDLDEVYKFLGLK